MGCLEATLLPASSLRRLRILFFDDLCEGLPISLVRFQVVFQVLFEFLVDPLCLLALVFSIGRGKTDARGKQLLPMPLQRLVPREEGPAALTKEYLERMRLCGLAVPHKVIPRSQVRAGAQLALEHIEKTPGEVLRRCFEERHVIFVKLFDVVDDVVLRQA